ncbi:MAG: tetratricopeptide repeat protein [Pseudomonadota bacterium]
MRLHTALLLSCLMPFAALAAGSDDTEPPKPTETTTVCEKGLIWDDKTEKCVEPVKEGLNDDQRFRAVRELAYAGRPDDALIVLATMTEGDTDRVLTYRGFALRKSGDIEGGIAAYEAALAQNPDNILAHSYFGQLLVELDELALARGHLEAIRKAGGQGTWAEASLERAIATGVTYSF